MGFHFDEIFQDYDLEDIATSNSNSRGISSSQEASREGSREESWSSGSRCADHESFRASESSSLRASQSPSPVSDLVDFSNDRYEIRASVVQIEPTSPRATLSHGHRGYYKHHASYSHLIRSAALGCELCMLFARDTTASISSKDNCEGFFEAIINAESEVEDSEKQIFVTRKLKSATQVSRRGASEILLSFCDDIDVVVEVFCYPDDDSSIRSIIDGRSLYSRHFKDILHIMPKYWLKDCLSNHPWCLDTGESILPTRVIDVGSMDGSIDPFILETKGSLQKPARGRWVALSHCWGGDIPEKTTSKNIFTRLKALPLQQLPQTFVDAIIVTRRLGLQYLWIDSFCILQDSLLDWANESAQMGNVYQNASLVLATTCSGNSTDGILNTRPNMSRLYTLPLEYYSGRSSTQGIIHFRRNNLIHSRQDRLPRGPLTSRAWTVQEKVLARRTLHFATYELIWECQSSYETESERYPEFVEDSILSLTLTTRKYSIRYPPTNHRLEFRSQHEEVFSNWYRIVSEYGTRTLSYAKDKLPAISAIAKQVYTLTNARYCAGLWKEDMHLGLIWSYDGQCYDYSPSQYIAPSWSWASKYVDPAKFDGRTYTFPTARPYYFANPFIIPIRDTWYDVEILKCTVFPSTEDVYGSISSASLTLRGLCLPAVYSFASGELEEDLRTNVSIGRVNGVFFPEDEPLTCSIICSLDTLKIGRNVSIPVTSINERSAKPGHRPPTSEHISLETTRARDSLNSQLSSENITSGSFDSDVNEQRELNVSIQEQPPDSKSLIHRSSIFIQIGKWYTRNAKRERIDKSIIIALLLEPTGTEDEFRRTGIAQITGDGIDLPFWKKKTVTII